MRCNRDLIMERGAKNCICVTRPYRWACVGMGCSEKENHVTAGVTPYRVDEEEHQSNVCWPCTFLPPRRKLIFKHQRQVILLLLRYSHPILLFLVKQCTSRWYSNLEATEAFSRRRTLLFLAFRWSKQLIKTILFCNKKLWPKEMLHFCTNS